MENKIYLNTIEDLTKALSEGKTVYCEIDDEGYKAQIKLINGILVQKQYDNDIYINAGDLIFEENAYYVKVKEPLKFEWGKFYKTANGKKALYYAEHKDDKGNPLYFFCVDKCEEFRTNSLGKDIDFDNDIVDYWEDDE